MMRVLVVVVSLVLSACATLPPPAAVNNVCHIFRQYPAWYEDAKNAQSRWYVPIHVQMAILHQESKFQANAKPPYQFLLGVIPMGRPSTAYGYTQALDTTWDLYRRSSGHYFASRQNFSDGVDFIGWYANMAYQRAKIPRTDAYRLYLAYHEGVGGYMNQTYLRKPWLMQVAHKVSAQAAIYQAQLANCRGQF
jgi:hypothetical protein